MNIDKIVEKFIEMPRRMDIGTKKLARQYHCDKDDIIAARAKARSVLYVNKQRKGVKILLLDIETALLKAYIWQNSIWKANVREEQIISEWFMLTWSAKWLFDSEIMSERLTGKEAQKENDARILKPLWKLLDEADVVISHNGLKFDVPNIKTRFLVNDLPPTSFYRQIDTLKVAQREFGFTHNNLNALARVLGVPGKTETDFELWKECVSGNEQSLIDMERYNKNDVLVLEDVYLKLRPWIPSHVNIGLYTESSEPVCANCGSEHIHEKGIYTTNSGVFITFKCDDCGAYSRGRQNMLSKDKKQGLLSPLPR